IVGTVRVVVVLPRRRGGQRRQTQAPSQILGRHQGKGLVAPVPVGRPDAVGHAGAIGGQNTVQRAERIGKLAAVAQRIAKDHQLGIGGRQGKGGQGQQQTEAQGGSKQHWGATPVRVVGTTSGASSATPAPRLDL